MSKSNSNNVTDAILQIGNHKQNWRRPLGHCQHSTPTAAAAKIHKQ